MKKKKNITIRIEPNLYQIIDENFDNKSKLIEWFIIEGLSNNDKYKEKIEKIIFNHA
jgi:flagellar biosynthesis/type III secretory pathway protein FliH